MPLSLYNTASQSIEPFSAGAPPVVSLYTCGPTVYHYTHIGNFRNFILPDILRRVLIANGFDVKHAMNITDVGHLTDDGDAGEDKMEKGSAREGRTAWEIASFYTDAFREDAERLNVVLPSLMMHAADDKYIQKQIALVQVLEKKGVTYTTSDGVYFDSSTFADYGKMAHLDVDGLQEGARVEKNPEKRHATDFALWKFSPEDERRQMEWNSPWGTGFPGWHIECSAMAMSALGETIDIHTGGVDLAPVHHTNEIAQSETATGKPFVRFWLHGEHLLLKEGKMSKSDGNILTVDSLVKKGYDPLAYRFFALSGHYRSKLTFTWEALDGAQQAYHKLIGLAASWENTEAVASGYMDRFMDAMNDDLNTPQALAVMWELVKSDETDGVKAATLYAMDEILGLSIAERSGELRNTIAEAGTDLHEKLAQRETARAEKDFTTADRIRDEIAAAGFDIEDTDEGAILKVQ